MPRSRSYRKRGGVFGTPEHLVVKDFTGTRTSVRLAAGIFCEAAKAQAAKFSRTIPQATKVVGVDMNRARVITDGFLAPMAAPFEFGERHPLYGNRLYWYKQQTKAYMTKAAGDGTVMAAALEAYGKEETRLLAIEFGYTY